MDTEKDISNVEINTNNEEKVPEDKKLNEKESSALEINTTSKNLLSPEEKKSDDKSTTSSKKSDKKNKEKTEKAPEVSFFDLFKYANKKEKIYIFLAIIGSIIQGLSNPLLIEYLSSSLKYFIALVVNLTMKSVTGIDNDDDLIELFDVLKSNDTNIIEQYQNRTHINIQDIAKGMQATDYGDYDLNTIDIMSIDEYWDKLTVILLVFVGLGVMSYVSSFLYFHFFMLTASLQSTRIRSLTFKAILNQEIEWHENVSPGELSTRIISDTILIEDGIGIKLGFLIEHIVTFLTCYIFAFSNQWLLSLEMASVIPLVVVVTVIMCIVLQKYTDKSQNAYASLGGIAQEAFTQIRTIVSFGTEQNEIDRYVSKLKPTRKYGLILANTFGSCLSMLYGLIYSSLSIAFICGSKAIFNGDMYGEDVYKVFMNIMIGSIYLSTMGSVSDAFGKATGAATKLFNIIERKPKFDKKAGEIPDKPLEGYIEFKNVRFNYPSRPDVEVLKGISFECKPGKTIALIGASGSGKSTVVQLLERFYEYKEGQILIDNKDIKDYNCGWLRSQIGLVSQEPTLFDTTIEKNISIGSPNATKEEIEAAAKLANAHDFIMKLPNGYQTSTGERGLQLSGGQKQRICIARALMTNPKILLLDEATSALDNKSEKIVQYALDSAAKGRTTLVIAHRLTTIRNADTIIVMENGVIVESGTHDELIKLGKAYYNLVKNQEMKINKEKELASSDEEKNSDENDDDDEVIIEREDTTTTEKVEMGRIKSNVSRVSRVSSISKDVDKTKLSSLKMDWRRFLKINKAYWIPNLIGLIGAAGNGSVQPVYAYIFGSALNVFNYHGDKLVDNGKYWGIVFLIFSILVIVVMYMQMGGFYASGECLTYTLRKKMFSSMIRQEIAYFDTNEVGSDKGGEMMNESVTVSTGTLTSKLATDATMVQNFNLTVGTILQQIVTIVVGFSIAFACTWKLTLILLVVTPFLFFGTYFVAQTYVERNEELRISFESSSNTACEAIENIKTVYALNLEDHFKEIYDQRLKEPEKTLFRKALKSGLGCGLGNSSQFIGNIAGILFGSILMISGDVEFTNMFRAVLAIMFTATAVGEANTIIPNITKSISAFNRVIEVLDRQPKIDARDPNGIIKKDEGDDQLKGDIVYKNIKFCYPSRPKVVVLRFGKDQFEVPSGKTCAIVGGSGCGKSTLIGLLLRWYDLTTGSIEIDKENNKNYNIKWIRKQMSIVNQEPSLFNISVKDNIRYGKIDATDEEIFEAAKKANIHDFIMSLPEGYDTKVGNLGTSQMSGGQKQRIAIARAIIRNPKILLLDEATSALDAESELLVQKALEKVSEGRSTITIAHRLSTIREAHTIIVMKDGYIEEIGNHKQLIEKKGEYYKMILAGDNIPALNQE